MSDARCIRAFLDARAPDNPFQTHDAHGGDSARVRFLGVFSGEETVWDAHIMTLEAVCRAALEQGKAPPVGSRQFIDIGAEAEQGRSIRIGLHVSAIDEPTVWKTITMVRNYKRLCFGRIEWGSGVWFEPGTGTGLKPGTDPGSDPGSAA